MIGRSMISLPPSPVTTWARSLSLPVRTTQAFSQRKTSTAKYPHSQGRTGPAYLQPPTAAQKFSGAIPRSIPQFCKQITGPWLLASLLPQRRYRLDARGAMGGQPTCHRHRDQQTSDGNGQRDEIVAFDFKKLALEHAG